MANCCIRCIYFLYTVAAITGVSDTLYTIA